MAVGAPAFAPRPLSPDPTPQRKDVSWTWAGPCSLTRRRVRACAPHRPLAHRGPRLACARPASADELLLRPAARRPLRFGAQRVGLSHGDSFTPPATPGLEASLRPGAPARVIPLLHLPWRWSGGRALRAAALGDSTVRSKRSGSSVVLPRDELLRFEFQQCWLNDLRRPCRGARWYFRLRCWTRLRFASAVAPICHRAARLQDPTVRPARRTSRPAALCVPVPVSLLTS